MRLFQNGGIYPSYFPRLAALRKNCSSFAAAMGIFLNDRYGAAHHLKPILEGSSDAFYTNGDDLTAQRLWARENGLRGNSSLEEILLAQIEHHRADVFYNSDPMRFGDAFLARLPGHVRHTIAWRAAPSAGGAFLKHHTIVNNFPSLLRGYREKGVRAEYFAPGHDPEMDAYSARTDRPIDVLFVGGYSRHHTQRAKLLEAIAALRGEMTVVMHLDRSKLTRLGETPLGLVGPLARHKRPRDVRIVAKPPVFGRDLLEALSKAKIVINGAVDMAGSDRGNMRVWEALGCGAAMISDAGNYPEGLEMGKAFLAYHSPTEAAAKVRTLRYDPTARHKIASLGNQIIRTKYSKDRQWQRFQEIVG